MFLMCDDETNLHWAGIFFPCLCFRYPRHDVYCSEQGLSDPGQSAGDEKPNKQGQELELELDSEQNKVCSSLAPLTFLKISQSH